MKGIDSEMIFKEEALVHFTEIFRAALRLTRKREEAEELAQDTFLQAWKSFGRYEPGTNCRAWLYQIMFYKHSAGKRKQLAQASHIQEADEFVFENATALVSISEHLTDEVVLGALDELPDYFRSVILLTDVYEFKYKDVSQILRIPIGTVMSRLNRARAVLRISLATAAVERGIINS